MGRDRRVGRIWIVKDRRETPNEGSVVEVEEEALEIEAGTLRTGQNTQLDAVVSWGGTSRGGYFTNL